MPGQSANWNLPYRAPLDAPDLAAATFALATATDTAIQTVKGTVPVLVHGASGLVGTYTGQAVKLYGSSGSFSTDANGDTVILAFGGFAGMWSLNVNGASTFAIVAAVRVSNGNLVARLWNGTTLAINTSIALTYTGIGW